MFWYFINEDRLSSERHAIDELFIQEDWLTSLTWSFIAPQLCVDFKITIDDKQYSARLTYPDLFPGVPPYVIPTDEEKTRWSGHQYGIGGEICLEWGPDNWMMDVTGADMIKSLYRLLKSEKNKTENPDDIIDSRHRTSFGQQHRSELYRFLFHESVKSQFTNIPKNTINKLSFHASVKNSCFIIDLHTITHNDLEWCNTVLPKDIHQYSAIYEGLLITTDNPCVFPKQVDVSSLIKICQQAPAEELQIREFIDSKDKYHSFISIFDGNEKCHMFIIINNEDERKLYSVSILPISTLTNSRHTGSLENIANKSVGIVGAGSLGSKIAVSLTRSGVKKFTFIDDDLFLPENICRHELDWTDVGENKVKALKMRCELIASDCECDTSPIKLTGQESNRSVAMAMSKLTKCDLIIDATADSSTFNLLSYVASSSKIPMCWGQVYAGGIGGFVARYRPEKDPDPLSIRNAYNKFCLDNDGKEFALADHDYTAQLDNEVMIADDHDVMHIAGHIAAFALDILKGNEPSDFPYSLYITGFQRAWIFNQPFDTRPLDLGEPLSVMKNDKKSGLSEENKQFICDLVTTEK